MIINKFFLSILYLLFFLNGCNNIKKNNVLVDKNILPLKVAFNDSLGLVVLVPKETRSLEYSNKEIRESLCFFIKNNSQIAQKSLLLIKDFSLYGKVSDDSSSSKNSISCEILKKNWLGTYNDSKTITIFPYDKNKREYLQCKN